ncbi:sterol desaturase family protein [Litorimonas haliclonae]|uniref:sterol desaturase family protein n=1 Tax=Litorimonas haliclonae TaxID=2081977 RepID=UPI0039EF6654
MSEAELSFPMILAWAAPLFVVSVALEWIFVHRQKWAGRYETRDAFASMTMGVGNLASDLLFGFLSLGVLLLAWRFRIFDFGHSLPIIVLALIAQDFVYYWKHRIAHRVRWFWSAHVVHHSSEHYNLTTALRQPWNNHFTGHILLSVPLVILGFHPLLIGFVASLNLLYQFWIHTEAVGKMPNWFEAVFNTPSHHRVHHGTNPQYLDMNYAGIFIIWDKLFGTFVGEQDDVKIAYGVVKPIETFNPAKIAFAEWGNVFRDAARKNLTLRQRLGYIFGPPGYSHDGSRQTSEDIKRDFYARRSEQD